MIVKAAAIPCTMRRAKSSPYWVAPAKLRFTTPKTSNPPITKGLRRPTRSERCPAQGCVTLLAMPNNARTTPATRDDGTPNRSPDTASLATYSGSTMIRKELPIASAMRATARARTRRSVPSHVSVEAGDAIGE